MSLEKQPRRLGRGLEALLSSRATAPSEADVDRSDVRRIPLAEIVPNPYQPRRDFAAEELAELEASLRSTGLLQPISVRPRSSGAGYELIAGERRLRAARRIGWTDIPALIRKIDDRLLLSLALVENLQRADLNPLEEAEGYQRLITEFELTQQQVAEAVGKDRSTVANMLRLLSLPASVKRQLQEGVLSLGHARALLSLGTEQRIVELAKAVAAKGLSVREVERLARADGTPKSRKSRSVAGDQASPEARRIVDALRAHLQTDVRLHLSGPERGVMEISFYSADDLERLMGLMLPHTRDNG